MIDPKPLAAFIEYTVKPVVDDLCELLNNLGSHGIKAKDITKSLFKLYIFDRVITLITSITVTGLICYTALKIL